MVQFAPNLKRTILMSHAAFRIVPMSIACGINASFLFDVCFCAPILINAESVGVEADVFARVSNLGSLPLVAYMAPELAVDCGLQIGT